MANTIDGAGGTGVLPPMEPLPIVGTIELAARTFAKAPFTLIGMSLIPLVPVIVIDILALLGPASVRSLLTLVAGTVQYVVQFAIMAATVLVTRNIVCDRERDVGDSIQQAMRRLLPLIGMLFLQFFAIALGFVLFVIPGIVVAIMLFVALPACVLEGLGPVASLKRSAQLTSGNRWRLFGMGLLVMVVLLMVGLLLSAVIATGSKIAIGIVILLLILVGIGLGGVALTLPTVVFLQLRQLHEPSSAP